jgi:hypothetical protein
VGSNSNAIAVILAVACCWRHCSCLHPFSRWHSAVASVPLVSDVVTVAGLPTIVASLVLLAFLLLLSYLLLLAFLLFLASLFLLASLLILTTYYSWSLYILYFMKRSHPLCTLQISADF